MGCGCGKGGNKGQKNLIKSTGNGKSIVGLSGGQRPIPMHRLPTPMMRQMQQKRQLAASAKREEQERVKKIRQRSIQNKLGLR